MKHDRLGHFDHILTEVFLGVAFLALVGVGIASRQEGYVNLLSTKNSVSILWLCTTLFCVKVLHESSVLKFHIGRIKNGTGLQINCSLSNLLLFISRLVVLVGIYYIVASFFMLRHVPESPAKGSHGTEVASTAPEQKGIIPSVGTPGHDLIEYVYEAAKQSFGGTVSSALSTDKEQGAASDRQPSLATKESLVSSVDIWVCLILLFCYAIPDAILYYQFIRDRKDSPQDNVQNWIGQVVVWRWVSIDLINIAIVCMLLVTASGGSNALAMALRVITVSLTGFYGYVLFKCHDKTWEELETAFANWKLWGLNIGKGLLKFALTRVPIRIGIEWSLTSKTAPYGRSRLWGHVFLLAFAVALILISFSEFFAEPRVSNGLLPYSGNIDIFGVTLSKTSINAWLLIVGFGINLLDWVFNFPFYFSKEPDEIKKEPEPNAAVT